ncbi:MAG: hypothetical protein COB51_06340 [Moraxellaceae bacterium]|nr:MAG: hypothetical protein COB51_06340 [Moraxellaceae bacterium]
MNKTVATSFNPDQWKQLEKLLLACGDENAFSALECHGLICATAIYPGDIDEEEIYDIIFDAEIDPTPTEFNALKQLIDQLIILVEIGLEQGQTVIPPCSLDIDANGANATGTEIDSPIRVWSAAFMQGVFLREPEWFDKDEDLVAQMSLPILVASDLVESEEMQEIQENHTLFNSLCKEIPNTLTDMYLFYRVS